MSIDPSQANLVAWWERIGDRRVRAVLAVVMALALIGGLILTRFPNLIAAVEVLAVVVVFSYAGLIIITTSAAFFPIKLEATDRGARAAERAQSNARVNLLLLIGLGVLAAGFVINVVAPVWPSLVFEASYQRLRWKSISISQFLETTAAPDPDRDELLDVRNPKALFKDGQLVDPRAVLRLVGQRTEVVVRTIDLERLRHSGVIAARKVIFNESSMIEMGGKDLLILAEDIEITGVSKEGAAIFAFRPKDVPPPPKDSLVGAQGKPAGSLTIVVLGRVVDGGRLTIDLRGQSGGAGPDGRQPDPRDREQDRGRQIGAPEWAFGEPDANLLSRWIGNIDKNLTENQNLGNEVRDRLKHTKIMIEQCMEKNGKCNTLYCRDLNYSVSGAGFNGKDGAKGGPGGAGGAAGDPGALEVYRLVTNSDTDSAFAERFRWLDGGAISKAPPAGIPGPGGNGGPGGAGAQGGLGYEADPLNVCSAGAPGLPGKSGAPGDPGKPGPKKDAGFPARLGRIVGL